MPKMPKIVKNDAILTPLQTARFLSIMNKYDENVLFLACIKMIFFQNEKYWKNFPLYILYEKITDPDPPGSR